MKQIKHQNHQAAKMLLLSVMMLIALLIPSISKADGIIKEVNPLGSPSDVISPNTSGAGKNTSNKHDPGNNTSDPNQSSSKTQGTQSPSSDTHGNTTQNKTSGNQSTQSKNTSASSSQSGHGKKTIVLGAGIKKSGRLNLEHVVFYYKTDEEVRFADKKTSYQSKARGQLPPDVANILAGEAYDESSVEQELPQWRYHGGPAPNIITAKAHLYNESTQARLNTHLNTVVRVKTGNMLVDPKTLLLDFNHLQKTAKWQVLDKHATLVPALAAGEDSREDVMRFDLLPFLSSHPNMWPVTIEITVKCPESGQTVTTQLSLTPDHFVVPTLY